jgi:hypothetical protein
MDKNLKRKGDSILLCCRKKKCPAISRHDENHVKITDDDGNTVKITIEQAGLIGSALKHLEK